MALEGDVSKRLRRQERLTVGSPVRGIVKSLEVTTIGGVAGAGQPLAVIVPLDEMLHAETRLPVSQIGHVRPGLPVHVKISAYDFTRFGWIEGRVSRVSPSSFSGDGMAYYKVQVDRPRTTCPWRTVPCSRRHGRHGRHHHRRQDGHGLSAEPDPPGLEHILPGALRCRPHPPRLLAPPAPMPAP
ncbi:HlyD family efflux transporter periplasmic adaptor subunit [Teichococcus aestuarii]|uniref:HlyD family efflux transporter periplasmic adaptor subunit n=1 Tax=Teichococcus aestuarii TaxID=568898 RepID=UPI003615BE97